MAHSILAVPEILRLVCELLTRSDQARLLTVSRRFFTCAAPLVWSTIWGPMTLPGLLPTVDWKTAERTFLADKQIEPLDREALLRFNLYAPYVKRLGAYHGLGGFWGTLLKLVPNRPILPNLQALELSRYFLCRRTGLIPQLNAFLCPTLTKLCCPGPGNRMLSRLLASQLSASLIEHCPGIHTLDIYTDYALDSIPTAGLASGAELSSSLAQFHNLRNLGGGPELLSPEALVALGSLPLLESLNVVYSWETPDKLCQSNISLPHDAFPALQHLGIYCLDWIEQASELWKLPPLVHHIISVYIDLDSASTSDEQIRQLICLISESSPLVSEFHIDLEPSEITEDRECMDVLSPIVISHLQQLPLRRLRISSPSLALKSADNFEQLALALPNIEYLDIQCYDAVFDNLVSVAKHMPKLRFLGIGISPLDWPPKNRLPRLTNPNPPIYFAMHYEDHNPLVSDPHEVNPTYIKLASRALHSLWPNGVHCGLPGEADTINDPGVHEELELMNIEIQKLCAPNTFSVPSFKDLGLEWKYINEHRIPWLVRETF